jgi:hypothetical protein
LNLIGANLGRRSARWFAWFLVGLFLFLIVGGLVFKLRLRNTPVASELPIDASLAVALMAASLVGATIASRLPRNPIGWIIALVAVINAADQFSVGYAYYGLIAHPGSLPGAAGVLLWRSTEASRYTILAMTLLFLWFPDGRPLSPRWGKLAWISLLATSLNVFLVSLKPGPISDFPYLVNQIGIDDDLWGVVAPAAAVAQLLFTLCLLVAILSLLVRLHRAKREERQQLKWFAYGAALFTASVVIATFGGPTVEMVGLGLIALSSVFLSAALAIAIFRYRLYDIDIIIRRTLVYGLLTAALTAIYFASVALLQGVLVLASGQQSAVAIVISTLAAAALFSRLRARIQRFINRSFYRQEYDAGQALNRFAQTAREEVDLAALTAELVGVIRETMQPEHISIRLKGSD